jgi:hypothetical protein
LALRNPRPIPRKLASKTKFEKYDRYSTFEPIHRIKASSKKSIKKLSATSRRR